MKKTLYTLNIGGYAPELTALTFPLLRLWAKKIGADFCPITERRWPDRDMCYEKLQIYYLGREAENDWNIYIDADALVHPDTPDPTVFMSKDTVANWDTDLAPIRWKSDQYFQRDGRHIGCADFMVIASDLCLDFWHPLDIPYDEAVSNIQPIMKEIRAGVTAEHLIDDYTCSRNVAKFGLKYTTFRQELAKHGHGESEFIFHPFPVETVEEKVKLATETLARWKFDVSGGEVQVIN